METNYRLIKWIIHRKQINIRSIISFDLYRCKLFLGRLKHLYKKQWSIFRIIGWIDKRPVRVTQYNRKLFSFLDLFPRRIYSFVIDLFLLLNSLQHVHMSVFLLGRHSASWILSGSSKDRSQEKLRVCSRPRGYSGWTLSFLNLFNGSKHLYHSSL